MDLPFKRTVRVNNGTTNNGTMLLRTVLRDRSSFTVWGITVCEISPQPLGATHDLL